MDRSLKIFFTTGHLSFMSPVDIAQLSTSFLTTFAANSIEQAWRKLTEEVRNDPEVLKCLRCREHICIGEMPPLKRDCIHCMLRNQIKVNEIYIFSFYFNNPFTLSHYRSIFMKTS